MKLKDRVAIVTGGSRGIGRAVAEAFLRNGERVAIAARTQSELSRTLSELGSLGEIIGRRTDVGHEAEVRDLVRSTISEFGSVDILVNAAAIQQPIGPFAEVNLKDWSRNIHTNLFGTAACCRAVLPYMIAARRGKIVNFSGGGAHHSRPNFSAYGVSKAAIVRLTEVLADEVAVHGIQVNAVSPGAIRTRMIEEILACGPEKGGREYELVKSKALKKNGFDSLASAVELVLYLASEASDGITGKVLSAVWDPWREWERGKKPRLSRDVYVLRRIDLKSFVPKKAG